jgi:hypothetical protein
MPTIKKQIIFLAREQAFKIEVNGLLPLTYHYFYVEKQKVDASNLKPEGKKIGEQLQSDTNGRLAFTYYFDANLETNVEIGIEDAQRRAGQVANVRDIILTNINASKCPDNYKDTSLSYWTSHIIIDVVFPSDNEFERRTSSGPQTSAAAAYGGGSEGPGAGSSTIGAMGDINNSAGTADVSNMA